MSIETFANPFAVAGWIAGGVIAVSFVAWIWRAFWAWRLIRDDR